MRNPELSNHFKIRPARVPRVRASRTIRTAFAMFERLLRGESLLRRRERSSPEPFESPPTEAGRGLRLSGDVNQPVSAPSIWPRVRPSPSSGGLRPGRAHRLASSPHRDLGAGGRAATRPGRHPRHPAGEIRILIEAVRNGSLSDPRFFRDLVSWQRFGSTFMAYRRTRGIFRGGWKGSHCWPLSRERSPC